MQAIKCELCGSNEFKKADGFFQCEHCGTKYTLEEAKKLMVSGTVEFVKGDAEKERLLKNAETYIKLKKYEDAESEFKKVTKQFPDDYRGWWGIYKIQFIEYVKKVYNGSHYFVDAFFGAEHQRKRYDENFTYFNDAFNLTEDKQEFIAFFKDFFQEYGKILSKINNDNNENYYDCDKSATALKYTDLSKASCDLVYGMDGMRRWIIFDSDKVFNLINDPTISNYADSIKRLYVDQVMSGDLPPSVNGENPPYPYTWGENLDKISNIENAIISNKYYFYTLMNKEGFKFRRSSNKDRRKNVFCKKISGTKFEIEINVERICKVKIIGRWLVAYELDEYEKRIDDARRHYFLFSLPIEDYFK